MSALLDFGGPVVSSPTIEPFSVDPGGTSEGLGPGETAAGTPAGKFRAWFGSLKMGSGFNNSDRVFGPFGDLSKLENGFNGPAGYFLAGFVG